MTEFEWLRIFGDNLITILNDNRMTQEELAEMSGVSAASISKYIRYQQMPSFRSLLNISYALGMSLDELTDFGEKID